MGWLDAPLISLDTETTGTDPETARIVQIAILSSAAGEVQRRWVRVVNPGVPIPDSTSKVHGFTDERVQSEGCTPSSALTHAYTLLRDAAYYRIPIVAHNAPYDLTVLDREFQRHLGEPLPAGLIVLDTLCLFRRFDWTTGGRSLTKLAARYGIDFPAHDALADARAAVELLRILGALNDTLGMIPPPVLHEAQVGWWSRQQDAAEARALGNGTPFVRQPWWPDIPGESVPR